MLDFVRDTSVDSVAGLPTGWLSNHHSQATPADLFVRLPFANNVVVIFEVKRIGSGPDERNLPQVSGNTWTQQSWDIGQALEHVGFGPLTTESWAWPLIRPTPHFIFSSAARNTLAEKLRLAAGLPVAELARMIGVSRATYHSWLSGGVVGAARVDRLRSVYEYVLDASLVIPEPRLLGRWLVSSTRESEPPIAAIAGEDWAAFMSLLRARRTTSAATDQVKSQLRQRLADRLKSMSGSDLDDDTIMSGAWR